MSYLTIRMKGKIHGNFAVPPVPEAWEGVTALTDWELHYILPAHNRAEALSAKHSCRVEVYDHGCVVAAYENGEEVKSCA